MCCAWSQRHTDCFVIIVPVKRGKMAFRGATDEFILGKGGGMVTCMFYLPPKNCLV